MFDNMIAVEHFDWFKERANRGLSNNYLVSKDQAKNLCIHSWCHFERLDKEKVQEEIKEAKLKDRMIAVSYHKEDDLKDCYELYVSVESALEIVEDKKLFVFKFRVLPEHISNEYKIFSV